MSGTRDLYAPVEMWEENVLCGDQDKIIFPTYDEDGDGENPILRARLMISQLKTVAGAMSYKASKI